MENALSKGGCNMATSEHKKSRPLYIAKFIRAMSDESHWVTQKAIMDYLYEEFGIMPDRKTIKRDIAMLRDQLGMDIEEETYKGYRLVSREFELDDLKILAECVYAAKFISEEKSRDLIDVLCEFCSVHQSKKFKREVFLVDRTKTLENGTLRTINTIREAMESYPPGSDYIRGRKIGFYYMTHSISDVHKVIEKHDGKRYIVSPHKLVINNGNYYLLGYEDEAQEVRTYRIDRMRNVSLIEENRNLHGDGLSYHMKTYTRRTFNMFGGKRTKVEMRFDNDLLDAVIDQFGVGFGAEYRQDGKKHFIVTTEVDVSEQFFAWLCGFGTRARLLSPEKVVKKYTQHISNIQNAYQ